MLRAYARTGVDPVLDEEDAAVGRADAGLARRELATALASAISVSVSSAQACRSRISRLAAAPLPTRLIRRG